MIALVKIDVAAAILEKSAAKIFELADGGNEHEPGLEWVFNLAKDLRGHRRDLRFWQPELLARAQKAANKYAHYKIEQVIDCILPTARTKFYAGEVDKLFQIRNRTRLDFGAAMPGNLQNGRNYYLRPVIAQFLERRWNGSSGGHSVDENHSGEKIAPSRATRCQSRCAAVSAPNQLRRNDEAIKRALRPFPQVVKKLKPLDAQLSAKTLN